MKRKTKKLIYNSFACALLLLSLVWVCEKFVHFGGVEYTENAQIKQHIVPVHARVQGYLKEVRFEEYRTVKRGDTLALIEDVEYRYFLSQAEANLEHARTGKVAMHKTISTTEQNLSATAAGVEEARAHLDQATRNYRRYEALFAGGAVTRQQLDDHKTAYEAALARYEMLSRQRESVRSVGREQQTRLGQNDAGIRLAEAAVELARLNLGYTVILAPCDGITGRKAVQVGQLVQPGERLLEVVDEGEKWIVANYKETQTTHIRPGQQVSIEVDAVPGYRFSGVVRSISRATGASFSLLKQDNSSGNFVKIEQRIPVRIDLKEENDPEWVARLGAGMNVTCEVKTKL